jgi:hypothetical protein
LKSDDLLKFRKKYKDEIEMLELNVMELGAIVPSVWYDIIGVKDQNELEKFKFRSVYNTTDEIINCIMEFNTMIKFDTEKNGYKNAKDRNNRFKEMGRQAKN